MMQTTQTTIVGAILNTGSDVIIGEFRIAGLLLAGCAADAEIGHGVRAVAFLGIEDVLQLVREVVRCRPAGVWRIVTRLSVVMATSTSKGNTNGKGRARHSAHLPLVLFLFFTLSLSLSLNPAPIPLSLSHTHTRSLSHRCHMRAHTAGTTTTNQCRYY